MLQGSKQCCLYIMTTTFFLRITDNLIVFDLLNIYQKGGIGQGMKLEVKCQKTRSSLVSN